MKPPPPHRATTAHLQALYPFVSDPSLGRVGSLIGQDLHAGLARFDPWELYATGQITSPNVLVLGQLGRGTSTFVKTLVWRQLAFGRRAWIVDPKGEYQSLAQAGGHEPVRLAPGGQVRVNPFDLPDLAGHDNEGRVRIRTELAGSLLSCALGRPLQPEERTAVEIALRAVSAIKRQPVIDDVVSALLAPDPAAAESIGSATRRLAAEGRVAALELRRLARGDLAGMFDGPTSPGIDLTAPVSVLDLSATFNTAALPLVMTCATAWLQSTLSRHDGVKRLVVMDEAWAVLADLATARWVQSSFKLSRAYGVANVVVVHRVSDLTAAGADGSAQQKLADGLLADSETRVVFGQSSAEAEMTGALLDLSRCEVQAVAHLPRGVALWKVGDRSYLVHHFVGRSERGMVDTDQAMTG